ncbi:hypothetical protein L4D76_27085 [Photobacterium sagamiensis]|uniref:alpha/beta hydrolase n=1 Tax=Photobacterium sagamiensis TaxID=2910241 RepID=UPI003D0F5FA3
MFIKDIRILLLITLFLFSHASMAKGFRVQSIKIDAPSLLNSKLINEQMQSLYISLPPSYFISENRYPVIYYFHGYGGAPSEAHVISGKILDEYIDEGKAEEMIVVGVNGSNQFGGSFYANSPIIGNWEDFVTNDVVNYIDNNYRTLTESKYRGVAGFSMGGYAAINIGFNHPDKFKHVFSLSPGLFDEKGLDKAVKQWIKSGWSSFLDGYAATFAPDPQGDNNKYWHEWDSESPSVRAKWSSGFGDVPSKVEDYSEQKKQLLSIRIEYGNADSFKWIPEGSRYLIQNLKGKGIAVEAFDHQGGHDLKSLQGQHIIEFFTKVFSSEN